MKKKQNYIIWIQAFIVYMKTGDIYKVIAEYFTFQTINQGDHYLKKKNVKVIRFMKNDFGRKIILKKLLY